MGTSMATLIETVNEILRKAEVGAALKTDAEADRDDELFAIRVRHVGVAGQADP